IVPPDSFSTAAPQSSNAFCSGCDAGTQCDSFSSKVLSCASAGVTPAVNSSPNTAAKRATRSVFLIDIISLVTSGLETLLRILLYDRIIIASSGGAAMTASKAIKVKGADIADESSHHRRGTGGIAAGPIAARLRHRQHYPGTSDAGLCARPHPRRPARRRNRGAAR